MLIYYSCKASHAAQKDRGAHPVSGQKPDRRRKIISRISSNTAMKMPDLFTSYCSARYHRLFQPQMTQVKNTLVTCFQWGLYGTKQTSHDLSQLRHLVYEIKKHGTGRNSS